ncbi:MAG: adenine deaminase [Dehalococcoidales bacterium]|nr:adenine deaminase [Dehalococcoidales bacterium]
MSPADGHLISVARGFQSADLIFNNASIVNVFSGEIEYGNVAVFNGRIVGIGDYRDAKEVIDLKGKYLVPGLIDGHVHLESSMLDVGQYARAVVSHGTLAIITDLHEISNVSGLAGIRYILNAALNLPLAIYLMAPSCVPATNLETSGAVIGPAEIRKILKLKQCIGLGEMMNYPGVLFRDAGVLEKINSASGKVVDGHSPGVKGKDLNAYIGAGIASDHESVLLEEAREKLMRGMHVMIREGSSEKNLDTLLPLVTERTYPRCLFVVDDRNCVDLLKDGDMDAVIRKAIRGGLDPIRAVQLATINAAQYFRLNSLGAIAPGYLANMLVLDDLKSFKINSVYYRGNLVAKQGKALFDVNQKAGRVLRHTVKVKPFNLKALALTASGEQEPVIEVIPGQIVTKKTYVSMKPVGGFIQPDIERDILKLAVIERHQATGNIGVGLVKGFGLKRGALASSVAHDSHNIVVVGTNDMDISLAVKEIEKLQGGLVVVADGKVLGSLALPVAGLLSDQPLEEVVSNLSKLEQQALDLGCSLPSPFSTLSFLALPVIPELRLTDLGLVDVIEFKLIKRSKES